MSSKSESAPTISSGIAKAVRWSSAGRIVAQLVRWAMTLVVIRILAPEDYGLVALAMTFLTVVGAVYELGLAPAVVQSKTLEEGDAGRIAGLILVVSMVIYVAFLVSAPWLAGLFNEPKLENVLRVLALIFPIGAISSVPYAMLRRNLDFKTATVLDVVSELSGAVITLALALLGYGVWSLIFGNLTATALGAILVLFVCPPGCMPRFDFRGTRRFVDFGGLIVLQRTISTVYRSADIFILGRVADAATVGLYSVALELGTMPLRKITPIVNEIAFAGFSRIQDDRELIADYQEKAFRFLLIVGLPIFVGMSCTAPEITAVILGPNWSAAVLPLQLLSLVVPLRLLADPLLEALNGIGQAKLALQNTLVIACLVIAGFLIGAPFGILGMCLAWLVVLPAAFIIVVIRSAPYTGLGLVRFLRLIGPPVASCTLMYLAVLGIGSYLPLPIDSILRLAVLVVTGAFAYGATILLLRPRDVADLWQFLRP